ncbi:MAG TPA: diacylglycerol kinase family protein [Thermoanaerobaculia bacterium]|nr:diacylglycerol kinase family protein [Thermoanaerobaculia bacterium]
MRVTVLVNRSARTVVSGELTPERVGAAFRGVRIEAKVEFVAAGEMAARAGRAAAEGAEAVVAGGGDGTVRAVAGALGGTATPLGVLPLGTLNHFAKDLGIPADLPGAAGVVATGTTRTLDLGEVNGQVFVNNASLGFYPPVVRERDRQRRRLGRNKWVAAASALVKVLPRVPALRLVLQVAGEEIRRTSRFVFVGNNEYSMNVFTMGARNRFDSGDLYLYIACGSGRLDLLKIALLALVRDATRSDAFESWCIPGFTIEVRRRTVPVFLDGEVLNLEPPLHFHTRARALQVRVPA